MNAYIPALKIQHDEIINSFTTAHLLWSKKQTVECQSELAKLLSQLKVHHQAECQLFFEKMRPNPRLNQGGPFCTYFFEFFMHNRPLVVAEKMIAAINGEKIKIKIPDTLNQFFSENSLLTIPLEEHLAIQALCAEAIQIFSQYEKRFDPWLDDVFDTLKDMITTNHRKEETCLWAAAQQIMDPLGYAELSKTLNCPVRSFLGPIS